MIQLVDKYVSGERGERQINKAIERLKSQLKDIKITIKL